MTALFAFRPELLDFRRGIHVGNLEENERITRILKLSLEERYRQSFITERWGRGVYWRWIGFLARANRQAKPLSSGVSFGCSKFFISLEPEEGVFKSGFQVERGFLKAPGGGESLQMKPDWDWNRLLKALRPGSPMEEELKRLLGEGFLLLGGAWEEGDGPLSRREFTGAARLKKRLASAPADQWAGLQVYYPMSKEEVRAATGGDLVESMLAVFDELVAVSNLCTQTPIEKFGP